MIGIHNAKLQRVETFIKMKNIYTTTIKNEPGTTKKITANATSTVTKPTTAPASTTVPNKKANTSTESKTAQTTTRTKIAPTTTTASTSTAKAAIASTSHAKTENDNQPKEGTISRRKQFAQRLKNQNLIRISIHRSGLFSNAEMSAILKHLRIQKIQEVDEGKNLIIAWANIGNIKHLKDITDLQCPDITISDEFASEIDQACQTDSADIDQTMNTLRMTFAPAIVQIPPLIKHPDPIIKDQNMPSNIYFNKRAFKNYSPIQIPENIAVLLAMGPKFSAPIYYQHKDFSLLKEAANFINETFSSPQERDTIRENIRKHITEYQENQYTQHGSNIRDFFDRTLKETKQFFKNHPEIIATQADKAKCSIIMSRDTYNNKVENLLKDTSTYVPIRVTSTPAYIKMNQSILDRMVEAKMISKREADNAKTSENRIANMYAFIKTHKKGEAARPIVNTRGSMGYAAANIVTAILTKIRETGKYNVLNSDDVINKLKDIHINPDEYLYSFDVVSMFTNIPVTRAITAIRKRQKLLKLNDEQMKIIIDTILFVCHKSTEITFNGKIYKQIKGLKMGSSLSPILSDFVVEDMLDQIFTTIERPILLIKYVDDILAVATEEDAMKLFAKLNEADEHIKFEMEKEQEGAINYLDITIYNKPFDLTTKWYQKHISSGRFLNFLSHHSGSVIINTAIAFVYRMINNTSNEYQTEILAVARHLLLINSFPPGIIDKIITKAQEKIFCNMNLTLTSSQQTTAPISKQYGMSIPYIPKASDHIKRTLESQSKRITPVKPIHQLSQEVFNPSKSLSSTPQPAMQEMAVIDDIDLTQN